MAQPLFGIVPAGLPVLTTPAETPSPTSFIFSVPGDKPFSHVVVFLLPGVQLPPGSAAAIYLVTPPTAPGQTTPSSRFLGGIGPGKESAIFKLGGGSGGAAASATVLGVSIEEAGSVATRIEELKASKPPAVAASGSGSSNSNNSSSTRGPSTLVLAQRIMQDAYNFLSSFSFAAPGQSGASGAQVVPLQKFQDWWTKFEGRVRSDPTFLERVAD